MSTKPRTKQAKTIAKGWDGKPTDLQVNTREFARMLRACEIAISTEETRYYLNGTYCETEDRHITLTATDGHRLVSGDLDAKVSGGSGARMIWARKSVKAARAWLLKVAKSSAYVRVIETTPNVFSRFETLDGSQGFDVRHVDGTFPDWRRVVPDWMHFDDFATVNRKEFLQCLETLGRLPKNTRTPDLIEYHSTGPVRITARDGGVTLSVNHTKETHRATHRQHTITKGERRGQVEKRSKWVKDAANDVTPCAVTMPATVLGKPVEIGASLRLLSELLERPAKTVRFGFPDNRSGPIRIDCGDGMTRVLMPMRI